MTQILDTIEDALETDFHYPVRHKRLRLPWLAGQVAEWIDRILQGVGLYHQKFHVLGEMNKTIACSVDKARVELGYSPRIALREGMRRSIQDLHDRGIRLK
jgi:nucleoside-diphosphate-sugar epimerase